MHGGSHRAVLTALLLVAGLVLVPGAEAQLRPPKADFTWTPQAIAAGQNVRFLDTSDGGSKGIQLYEWDWGDGSRIYRSRVIKNVTHVFPAAGTYDVMHTIYDRGGNMDSITKSVTVLPAQSPAFTLTRSGATITVNAGASTSPNGDVVGYRWVWGDGSPNGTGIFTNHKYAAPGTYQVNLTTTDGAGTEGYASRTVELFDSAPVVDFTVSASPAAVGQTVRFSDDSKAGFYALASWAWLVDGVEVGTGRTLERVFDAAGTHNVTLRVTDTRGLGAEAYHTLRVAEPPRAQFDLAVDSREVTVQASASDPDGNLTRVEWDWGDGAVPATGLNASHTYLAAGTYNVTLTVVDSDGFRVSVVKPVEVKGRPVVVAFDVSPQPAQAGHEVRFVDGSVDPDGPLVRWQWEMGEGGIAEGAEVVYIYPKEGRYVVNLTATDGTGGHTRASRVVVVEAPPPPPTPTTQPAVTTKPTTGTTPPATTTVQAPAVTTGATTTPAVGGTPNADLSRTATTPAPTKAKESPGAGLAALALAAAAAVLVLRRRA